MFQWISLLYLMKKNIVHSQPFLIFSKTPCQFCQPKCFPPQSTHIFYNNIKARPQLFTAPLTKLEVSHNCQKPSTPYENQLLIRNISLLVE